MGKLAISLPEIGPLGEDSHHIQDITAQKLFGAPTLRQLARAGLSLTKGLAQM